MYKRNETKSTQEKSVIYLLLNLVTPTYVFGFVCFIFS